MITSRKYVKMLGMDIDEVCKTIDKLSEKDAKDFMKLYFIRNKYQIPLSEIGTNSPCEQEAFDLLLKYTT